MRERVSGMGLVRPHRDLNCLSVFLLDLLIIQLHIVHWQSERLENRIPHVCTLEIDPPDPRTRPEQPHQPRLSHPAPYPRELQKFEIRHGVCECAEAGVGHPPAIAQVQMPEG